MYKNVVTGETGAKAELNAGVVSLEADNPTPDGGSFNGGGPDNIQYSASFLGFQFNFKTGQIKFAPSKRFSLGVQVLIGAEVSFNSDTYMKISAENKACTGHF